MNISAIYEAILVIYSVNLRMVLSTSFVKKEMLIQPSKKVKFDKKKVWATQNFLKDKSEKKVKN